MESFTENCLPELEDFNYGDVSPCRLGDFEGFFFERLDLSFGLAEL